MTLFIKTWPIGMSRRARDDNGGFRRASLSRQLQRQKSLEESRRAPLILGDSCLLYSF